MRNSILVLALGMFLLSCSQESTTEIDELYADSSLTITENSDFKEDFKARYPINEIAENDVLLWVNWHRNNANLPPLKLDEQAKDHATQHTNYMLDEERISHDNFDIRANIINKAAAENVARAHGKVSWVVQNWMNSEGHKKNILGNYTHTGISVQKNVDGIDYYTQIFIKK